MFACRLEQDHASAATVLTRADLHEDHIELSIDFTNILGLVRAEDEQPVQHQLAFPLSRLRRGKDVRLVLGIGAEPESRQPNPALIRLLASARSAMVATLAAKEMHVDEVARRANYSPSYRLLLRLATLAPSIVSAIVEGRQPVGLNRQKLATIHNLPIDWDEQRAVFGFA